MSEPILRVEDLRKRFNGTVANDGITLSVEAGESHAIIGPNGSGKTTLFNTITGVLDSDGGRVQFDGEDITGLPPDAIARRGLVRTFQIPTPFGDQTVRQNIFQRTPADYIPGFEPRSDSANALRSCSNY